MLDQVTLRILEITLSTQHKVCAIDRKLDDMARRRTRASIAPYLSAGLIRWYIALALLAAGHFTANDLRGMLGIRHPSHTDGSR